MANEYLADGVHPLPAGADYAAEKLAAVLKEFHEKGKMPNEATPTPTVKPTEKPIATATSKPEATNKTNATKAPVVTEIPEIPQENKSDLTWLWISVGAVALAGCVVAAVIIIKKKKSAKQ